MSRFKISKKNVSEVVDRQKITFSRTIQVLERYHLSAVFYARLVWEWMVSTFLDINGNMFCDKDGNAFMGKD